MVVVRSMFGHGTVAVRSWYGRGSVMVRSRFGHGTVTVRSWYGRGAVMVRSRYSLGTLPIRSWYGTLKVRSRLLFSPRRASNLVHALYDLLFAVRSRCGEVLSGYACCMVHSRFIPAWYSRRASNLVHVLYVLVFVSRNRGFTLFILR